jgi:hypothetical protein
MIETTAPSIPQETLLHEIVEELSRFDGPVDEFFARFIESMARCMGADGGAVLRVDSKGEAKLLSLYPQPRSRQPAAVWLRTAAKLAPRVTKSGETIVKHLGDPLPGVEPESFVLLLPLRSGGKIRGAVAMHVPSESGVSPQLARERGQLVGVLMHGYETRLKLAQRAEVVRRLQGVMETACASNEQSRFGAAALALCNAIAERWSASRVALGRLRGRAVVVEAISHTEHFSRKTLLARRLEAAMEECLDQDVEVVHPCPQEAMMVSRAAAGLAAEEGGGYVCAMPWRVKGEATGVLIVERSAQGGQFTLEEVEALRVLSDLVGSRLMAMAQQDRWIGAKAVTAIHRGLAVVLRPEHTWAKAAALALIALAVVFTFARGEYRVDAAFEVQAENRRVLPAPYVGFLKSVHVKPGDVVATGALLAELDTDEMRLELAGARAQRVSLLKEAYLAGRDAKVAEAQIARARAAETEAQIAWLEQRIARARITAVSDGVVLTGEDLEKRVGGPVEAGEMLFEVAPLEALRADLFVTEDRVLDLTEGYRGQLACAAHPGDYLGIEVERVSPVAELRDSQNVFRVRVRFEDERSWLRPGMQGLAKVDAGPRLLIWIWTREMVNFVRMKLWV